jgi:ferredoxin
MPEVTILPDGIRARADQDETLLRALGRAGLRYRVGCRRGGCGICKVRLVLGEVRYERPIAASVLTDDERVEGICLSCRAVPITNIVIELQEGDRLRKVLGFAYQKAANDLFTAGLQAARIVVNNETPTTNTGKESN